MTLSKFDFHLFGDKAVFQFKDPMPVELQKNMVHDMLSAVSQLPISQVEIDITLCKEFSHLGFGSIVTFRLSPSFVKKTIVLKYQKSSHHQHVQLLKLGQIFVTQPLE